MNNNPHFPPFMLLCLLPALLQAVGIWGQEQSVHKLEAGVVISRVTLQDKEMAAGTYNATQMGGSLAWSVQSRHWRQECSGEGSVGTAVAFTKDMYRQSLYQLAYTCLYTYGEKKVRLVAGAGVRGLLENRRVLLYNNNNRFYTFTAGMEPVLGMQALLTGHTMVECRVGVPLLSYVRQQGYGNRFSDKGVIAQLAGPGALLHMKARAVLESALGTHGYWYAGYYWQYMRARDGGAYRMLWGGLQMGYKYRW